MAPAPDPAVSPKLAAHMAVSAVLVLPDSSVGPAETPAPPTAKVAGIDPTADPVRGTSIEVVVALSGLAAALLAVLVVVIMRLRGGGGRPVAGRGTRSADELGQARLARNPERESEAGSVHR